MIGLLALLFLVVPLVELWVIIQVAGGIGVAETLVLLVGVSLAGAWLVRVQGLGVFRRVQQALGERRLPAAELVDGVLILGAGALMLTPGFITDGVGLLLLIPPTRAVVRTMLIGRFRGRVAVYQATAAPSGGPIDVDGVVTDDRMPDPPTAGPTSLGP